MKIIVRGCPRPCGTHHSYHRRFVVIGIRKLHLLLLLLFITLLLSSCNSMTMVPTTTVSSSDVRALADRSLSILDASDRDQVFIGIAGGPGSGKSSVARAVCDALNKEEEISIVVPMDGYHYSKAELKRLGNLGKVIGDPEDTKGESTTYEDLMARRGAPWTFCPKTLIRDLTEAKSRGKGTFPIYSREISDPVPDGVELTLQHKIVLCEGNYLLAFDDEDWKPLEQIWDDKWYVSVPQDIVVDRLVDRHLKRWNESKIKLWGEGRSGATAKAKASDLKNFRWVEKNCKPHAVLIVENY